MQHWDRPLPTTSKMLGPASVEVFGAAAAHVPVLLPCPKGGWFLTRICLQSCAGAMYIAAVLLSVTVFSTALLCGSSIVVR